jgi:phosphoribosyl 1,2-cyclic phosphodiesterase
LNHPVDDASPVCNHPSYRCARTRAPAADGERRIPFCVSILASGSSGNATLLETGRTTLLIDAGLGRKEMHRRFEALGRPCPARVDGILISHEHSDHSSGLAQMQREWGCPAYLTEPTHREILKMLQDAGAKRKIERVEYIHAGVRLEIGEIEITPFSIPHDAADPVGYAFRANGVKVVIVTDLGYLPELVKHHLREADCLILESNHDLEMLKVGPYPWYIKQRVMSRTGHLSATLSWRTSPRRTTRLTLPRYAPSRLSPAVRRNPPSGARCTSPHSTLHSGPLSFSNSRSTRSTDRRN